MKTEKKVTTTSTVIDKVFFDLCKEEIKGIPGYDFETVEEIEYRKGTCLPDTCFGTSINIDICPCCFTEKLIPWLESQGAVIDEKGFDL